MSYLLDTNVVSEVRRPHPAPQVVAWVASVPRGKLFLSVLVIGEIRRGIEGLRRRDPTQSDVYELWLDGLRERFAGRIIPVDVEIAEIWGRMNARDRGPIVDGLMAATAEARGLVLVTRNVTDVARTGVRVLNPWEPSA